MTPETAERALYSDILNLAVARKEYSDFHSILGLFAERLEVTSLLKDVLEDEAVRSELLQNICSNEDASYLLPELTAQDPGTLTRSLIEGVTLRKDNLTRFLSKERYALRPLHNFFFTRDSAVAVRNRVIISRMANTVRERESLIMETIFRHHPAVKTEVFNPGRQHPASGSFRIEGGDILVPDDNILLIGVGSRTDSIGVDYILDCLRKQEDPRDVIIQELPDKPESFIHLDMCFTFVDDHRAVVYEPLILRPNRFQTAHIRIENGEVKFIRTVENIPAVLKDLGREIEPVLVGGTGDPWIQEREQWHSGANFFALAPGKIMGYERNLYTIEELAKAGLEPLKAADILSGKTDTAQYNKFVITLEGSELARGGGGCRCMTMPVRREKN